MTSNNDKNVETKEDAWRDDPNEDGLDSLFEADSAQLKQVVRRAKRKSTLRTMLTSVIGTVVVLVGVLWTSQSVTDRQQTAVERSIEASYTLFFPDTFIGETRRFKSTFGGSVVYATYKLVDGRVVYTGDHDISFGLFGDHMQGIESQSILGETMSEDEARTRKYNLYGQREMIFYYPFLHYTAYRHDLSLLGQIGSGRRVEMALSFNKGYSVEQVKRMLKGQRVTWYWVNDLRENEIKQMRDTAKEAASADGLSLPVRSEQSAVGIKSIDANGEQIADPVGQFLSAVKLGAEDAKRLPTNSGLTAELQSRVFHVAQVLDSVGTGSSDGATSSGSKPNDSVPRPIVYGAVVTGTPEQLQFLKKQPFIQASSLGAIADEY